MQEEKEKFRFNGNDARRFEFSELEEPRLLAKININGLRIRGGLPLQKICTNSSLPEIVTGYIDLSYRRRLYVLEFESNPLKELIQREYEKNIPGQD